MSDLIQWEAGQVPWRPTSDTEVIEVLHEHDGPLLAVISQHSAYYMARCVLGALEDMNLWVYSHLTASQEYYLQNSADAEHLEAFAESLSRGNLLAALVDEERGLFFALDVDVPVAATATEARRLLIGRLREALASEHAQIEVALNRTEHLATA